MPVTRHCFTRILAKSASISCASTAVVRMIFAWLVSCTLCNHFVLDFPSCYVNIERIADHRVQTFSIIRYKQYALGIESVICSELQAGKLEGRSG